GLRRLCGLKILRESSRKGTSLEDERYDFYHNRIREAIKAEIPEQRTKILHRRLAETIAQLRPEDSESLVRELLLAGDEARAASHAEHAAESALRKLAHARAVDLYQLALRHCKEPAKAAWLRLRLAHSLEGSGRFRDAIEHYREGLAAAHLSALDRLWNKMHLANCLMIDGDLEASGALCAEGLADFGHKPERPRLLRALSVLWLLLRAIVGGFVKKPPRAIDDPETSLRLYTYSMAIPHYQFTSRNLEQLEFALRYRLLGARSPSPEVRQEAAATSLILLLPFAHLGGRIGRRVDAYFAQLEEGATRVAGDRARMWLPLLRALY